MIPAYAPMRMQRLIVHMDTTRLSTQHRKFVAYGCMFPDGKIALWHRDTCYTELHLNLESVRVWYEWMGNVSVEFIDV